MSKEDPITQFDPWEKMMEKARKNPLWVDPPGRWPTVYCPPRRHEWYEEQLVKKNFRAIREAGIVYWDPEVKLWMNFNDDFSPYKWSGTPKVLVDQYTEKQTPQQQKPAVKPKKPEQITLF